jgi:parallel beta-helix repeat protein
VQVSRGANATIDHNTVTDNQYAPQTDCSVGLLLFSPGQVDANHNTVARNDCSIFLQDSTAANVIDHNDVSDNTFDGIDLFGTVSNANVTQNKITGSGSDGIFVDTNSTGNVLDHNKIDASGGFDADDTSAGTGTGGTGNTWTHNDCTTDNHGGALCNG